MYDYLPNFDIHTDLYPCTLLKDNIVFTYKSVIFSGKIGKV